MFIALDNNNCRIDVCEANDNLAPFHCEICGGELRIKDGKINAKHFAHKTGQCSDEWSSDMSEWHKHMQEYFPIENREVVIRDGSICHRADVMINNTVIEFQHSPISSEEFEKRNHFFKNHGYKVAWFFDLSNQYDEGNVFCSNSQNNLFVWKHPFRIFKSIRNLNDCSDVFSLWFMWDNEDSIDAAFHVKWCINEEGNKSFRRFVIADSFIDQNDWRNFDTNILFSKPQSTLRKKIDKIKKQCEFNYKYSGKKGQPKNNYICPLQPQKFGINIFGSRSCTYCRYCALIIHKKENDKNQYAACCCYPKQIREIVIDDPEYECDSCDFYDL